MPLELWLAFVAASAVMLVIPGPTILTVIGYSVAHGRRAQLPLVAGVALGDSTALVLSLLGLGALLATSATWFTVIKWTGGLYLLYLGARMLREGFRAAPATGAAAPAPNTAAAGGGAACREEAARVGPPPPSAPPARWRLFASTYAVTALNPKGIVFFVAFLPQFIAPDVPVAPQLWILSLTFVALATLNAGLYAAFAGSASTLLRAPAARRGFHLGGGALLTMAGLWALLARRAA